MVALDTGHQGRCILWKQEAIFNKGVGFPCGLKLFALNIFGEEYLQPSLWSMLLPLKFKNGAVILTPTLQGMGLLIHAGIKVKPC